MSSRADSSSARLPSWGSLWITLWILPAAASVLQTWDSPATTGSRGSTHSSHNENADIISLHIHTLTVYALNMCVCVCPELQMRRTEEHLQGFMIHRRSAPPPSPPPLPLRLVNPLPCCSLLPPSLSCDFFSSFSCLLFYFTLSFLSLFSSLLSFYGMFISVCVHTESLAL